MLIPKLEHKKEHTLKNPPKINLAQQAAGVTALVACCTVITATAFEDLI